MTTTGRRVQPYRDIAGEWRWRLIADNGQIIATSGEGYEHRARAVMMATDLFPVYEFDETYMTGDTRPDDVAGDAAVAVRAARERLLTIRDDHGGRNIDFVTFAPVVELVERLLRIAPNPSLDPPPP